MPKFYISMEKQFKGSPFKSSRPQRFKASKSDNSDDKRGMRTGRKPSARTDDRVRKSSTRTEESRVRRPSTRTEESRGRRFSTRTEEDRVRRPSARSSEDRVRRPSTRTEERVRRPSTRTEDRVRRPSARTEDRVRRPSTRTEERVRRPSARTEDRVRKPSTRTEDRVRRPSTRTEDRVRRPSTRTEERVRRPSARTEERVRRPSTRTEDRVKKTSTRPDGIRLNKFIANSGVCSRREADEYITAGLVSVNGEVVTELGVKVQLGDDIRFNGERLKGEKKVYIVMNKPKDFVTTMGDPYAEDTVMDLIGDKCPERVFPVGRLDKATTGVLLFTNDGELAEQLSHPSYNKKKVYHIFLDKNLKTADFQQLLDGVELEDGLAQADGIAYVDGDNAQVGLEIHSGRNRIVRRMFEALGYRVKKLDRVYFAGITKKNLKRGQWRFLSDAEVNMLRMGAYE